MAIRTSAKLARRRGKDRGMLSMLLLCVTSVIVAVLVTRKNDVRVDTTPTGPSVVAEFDTVSVPVPTEYVPTGTKLSAVRFQQIAYPKHQLPPGSLVSVDSYLNAVTIAPLPANLPIFAENLSLEATSSNPVIESIPAGMRAITLQVDATSAVEGWAGSGSVIDVLLVEDKKTSVIAEKVKILSAERSVTPVNAEAAPNVPKTVTLLVTQEQCLAINTAIPLGRIAFALRGTSDSERWIDTSYSPDELRGKSRVVRAESTMINGFIAVQEGGGERKFALSEGKWIPTEVVPEGFLVAGGAGEKARFKAP